MYTDDPETLRVKGILRLFLIRFFFLCIAVITIYAVGLSIGFFQETNTPQEPSSVIAGVFVS